MVITTPLGFKFEKYKVFEMVTHFLIGQFGEYLRSTGQEGQLEALRPNRVLPKTKRPNRGAPPG